MLRQIRRDPALVAELGRFFVEGAGRYPLNNKNMGEES